MVAPKGEKFLQKFYGYLKRREKAHEEMKAVDEEKALLEHKYMNARAKAGHTNSKGLMRRR